MLTMSELKTLLFVDTKTNQRYSGILDCVVKSYRSDGWKVFFRGFTLMSVRAFPLNGATFLGYEYSMKLLKHLDQS